MLGGLGKLLDGQQHLSLHDEVRRLPEEPVGEPTAQAIGPRPAPAHDEPGPTRQPIASRVTEAPWSSSSSGSAGMAVISLELAPTATWPSDRRWAVAQALTECSGPSFADPEPRNVLPSMATCRMRRAAATACTDSRKYAWNACGRRRSKTRSKVSCDGTPWGKGRKRRSQSLRLRPKV